MDQTALNKEYKMLHQLIQSAQSNFIKLSHEPALLDDVYAQERARAYAVTSARSSCEYVWRGPYAPAPASSGKDVDSTAKLWSSVRCQCSAFSLV